ncbi:hypothetical protein, partial [Aeromonas caviae]|uniref:hypothetical protein n=1 Tax=Aeromonas caviae TaxID=648 RepID=UPI002B467AA6
PLSTCGNKPACGNARLVTNKNGARGSVVQCGIHPGRSALALFPLLCQQGFVPPAHDGNDVVHWQSGTIVHLW